MRSLYLVFSLLLTTGLSHRMGSRFSDPSVRVYNASHSASNLKLDFFLDGAQVASAVRPNSSSGPYIPADPEHAKFEVRKQDQAEDIASISFDAMKADHVLVLVGDPESDLEALDMPIASEMRADKQPQIFFLDAVPNAASPDGVDVYVLKGDQSIDSASPAKKAMTYKSNFRMAVAPDTYTVVITKQGDKTPLARGTSFQIGVTDRRAVIPMADSAGNHGRVVAISL